MAMSQYKLSLLEGIPTTFFLISVLAFYRALFTSLLFVKALYHLLLLILTYYSLAASHYFTSPLDGLWRMMLMVWLSHSASILWFEESILPTLSPPHDEQCTQKSLGCSCDRQLPITGLW